MKIDDNDIAILQDEMSRVPETREEALRIRD
jgi:hypothetical protein